MRRFHFGAGTTENTEVVTIYVHIYMSGYGVLLSVAVCVFAAADFISDELSSLMVCGMKLMQKLSEFFQQKFHED